MQHPTQSPLPSNTARRAAVRRIGSGVVAAGAALGLAAASVSTAHAATSADRGRPSAQIIGGSAQANGAYPFMAALLSKGKASPFDRQFCGGSLYSADIVMTAAHCVMGTKPKEIETVVGRTVLSNKKQGQLRNVADIVIHPRYLKKQEAYDVAFLILKKPVNGIAPVRIPTVGTDALIRPGAKATVIGWGNTNTDVPSFPDRLRAVDVPIVSHVECKATYPQYDKKVNVCAGVEGKDSCQGDSGGPLFRKLEGRVYQIGIVSYGEGCAEQGAPGVYTYPGSDELWDTLDESAKGKKLKARLGR
ncbi:serine protease [Streptomyces ipomoeae]|jgi:secreted trypsin-like serine protease|uniref:Trypsin n=2 Tax=Streptomyces ipomoeae TaxID=103232 RepID=L1L8B7_9ACTN|nr:serine protease [Streptomyces ipomoeae]EKX68858.1 trypsin [Streptomyces ipomoeae 91-03]MDX2822616.1 serine protease [Streptomyces ipomoeae]MDX2840930.1 serine protease [Streptomyces ipomoeae]MDX2875229.1 serine protease [Streptomyces ipomoeae]TQE24884.1 serine protease [Streptomyces ipomoeae]